MGNEDYTFTYLLVTSDRTRLSGLYMITFKDFIEGLVTKLRTHTHTRYMRRTTSRLRNGNIHEHNGLDGFKIETCLRREKTGQKRSLTTSD